MPMPDAVTAALQRAAARDAEAKAMNAWQPIETAPKDGTEVLLLTESVGVWDEPDPAVLRGGWRRTGERDRVVGWMPRAALQDRAPSERDGG
ncbi:MAG: hypothetical protein ACJ8FU_08270 [Xanthobacteraceae bacterium]